MSTQPRSLLRFVQLRRLTDTPDQEANPCMIGPTLIDACFNFSDDWSKPIHEAIATGDRERARALYRARRDALSDAGTAAARLALGLLRFATINQRLTVGTLRERLHAWSQRSQLTGTVAERAIEDATTWAVDMLTLRRWLGRAPLPGTSEPARVLRGMVLVRLALSRAEDTCQIHKLISNQVLQLPPLTRPQLAANPLRDRLLSLATLRRDLARMQSRTRAISRNTNPTLADLREAAFPDLAGSLEALERAATEFGLPPTVRAKAMQRVLDTESAEVQRLVELPRDLSDLDYADTPYTDDAMIAFPIVPVLYAEARVIGRGDLMIIRTSHLRYEASDISYIENVLVSEARQRTHVIDTATRETITEGSKTSEETTQDLETTEQNNLDRATQSAASASTSMSLGVSVSGGLGPVQAGLDINLSHSTSTSTSTSSAVSYAKSITEKASETLRSEAAYRRTITSTTRVTETNLHKFDNTAGAANIAGIYQWLDKVDQAQVYNYGERLMIEFIVPEPAAPYVYLKQLAEAVDALVPPANWELDIEELNEGNYVDKAARWDVVGLEPPPAEEIFASATFIDPAARPFDYPKDSTDKSQPEWGYSSYVGEVVVPEGYAASVAYVTVTWALEDGEYETKEGNPPQAVQIAIGEDRIMINDSGDGEALVTIDHVIAGSLPIGISSDQRGGLTVVVRVLCVRTDEAYEAWRLGTYETIRAGYLAKLDSYETDLRLQQSRQAYVATTSPDANRLIEMQELKRGCQTILSGQDFDLFGAIGFPESDIPRIEPGEARVEADYIQYFEDVLDWLELVYLFYPYQWAGRARWAELQSRLSTDPLHQAFLQAGAARVVVPVRSGYEYAIGSYLTTSEIPTLQPQPWHTGTNPYPPIEELIADALDRPGDEVAVGDPWEVVTPTSLIYLQAGPELNP